MFLSKLYKYIKGTDAAVLPIAALMFPIILGMAGLGIDAGNWLASKRNLQNAADAAAIAAAWEIAKGDAASYEAAALKEAMANGYEPASGDILNITISTNADGNPTILAHIEQNVDIWFSRIFIDEAHATVEATAELNGVSGEFCVLSLDDTADGAISTFGVAEVFSPNCGIASNSDSARAIQISGNATVDVGRVQTVGGIDIVGGSADFSYSSLNENASAIVDPYADLDAATYTGNCDNNSTRAGNSYSASGTITLTPGTYCGGLKISGNSDIVFEPGVYVIDGGDFDITGGGNLYGEEVSFIFTNSGYGSYAGMDISGDRSVYFSAPLAGDEMEGVVFFQDRDAPIQRNLVNQITGSSTIDIDGVAYFPSQELRFGGNANAVANQTSPCTKLIARVVTFGGNPRIQNNCDQSASLPIGTSTVQLVN